MSERDLNKNTSVNNEPDPDLIVPIKKYDESNVLWMSLFVVGRSVPFALSGGYDSMRNDDY